MSRIEVSTTQKVTGLLILITLIIGGVTLEWAYDRDYSKLYKDGDLIARSRWQVVMERTYSVIKYNYQIGNCARDAGIIKGDRCYYPKGYYTVLNRRLTGIQLSQEQTPESLNVYKLTPYYKYSTAGSIAGSLAETFTHSIQTERVEDFPSDYKVVWQPKDNSTYRLVWVIDKLKINQPDGRYNDCSYIFGDVKIDLGRDCRKLDFAILNKTEGKVLIYFKPEQSTQFLSLALVDPPTTPFIANMSLTSTDRQGYYQDNLSLSFDVGNATSYENITNWYLNNSNLFLVNLPFEGGSNATYTRNYGNGNNGSVINATWNSTGGWNGLGCYEFNYADGINESINVTIPDNGNNSITLHARVKVNDTTGCTDAGAGPVCPIITIGNITHFVTLLAFNILGNSVFLCSNSQAGGGAVGLYALNLNEWYDVVCVQTEENLTLYVNGAISGTTGNYVSNDTDDVVRIGGIWDVYFFNGSIDDVWVVNKSLTAEQIAMFNNTEKGIHSSQLNIGDTWKACSYANDQSLSTPDSQQVCSNEIIIRNSTNAQANPSNSNIFIKLPFNITSNESVIFTVEFGTTRQANRTMPAYDYYIASSNFSRNYSSTGMITLMDKSQDNFLAKNAKTILGLNKLPFFYNRTDYLPFKIMNNNTNITAGEVFNFTINFSKQLTGRQINESLDNNSLLIYAHYPFGGCYYNSSRNDSYNNTAKCIPIEYGVMI